MKIYIPSRMRLKSALWQVRATHIPSHVSRAEKRDDISVLKAGIVYGANASGKSNVIKTIALLQQIANGSFPQSKVEPFKLADTEEKL